MLLPMPKQQSNATNALELLEEQEKREIVQVFSSLSHTPGLGTFLSIAFASAEALHRIAVSQIMRSKRESGQAPKAIF